MNRNAAKSLLEKARALADRAGEACLVDENYFAKGMDGDKWVAWILMIPGHEVMVYDVTKNAGTGWPTDQLSHQQLDRMLQLKWIPAKPVSALDAMARAAAKAEAEDSGPGDVTVYDGEGKGITDAPKSRPKEGAQHLEDLTDGN